LPALIYWENVTHSTVILKKVADDYDLYLPVCLSRSGWI